MKYKLLVSIISILNLTFLKLWIFSNVFNINNFYSVIGIDYRVIVVNLCTFIVIVLFSLFLFKYLEKKEFHLIKNIFFFLFIIISLNSIRSVISINIFSINTFLKISLLIFFLIFLFIFFFKFRSKFWENSFYFLGLGLFPFFIIVLFKIFIPIILLDGYKEDNFYKELIYYKESKTINNEVNKNKVIWLIFDQYDYSTIKKNIEKLPNFKSISEVSDNYVRYSPNTVETIKTIPSIIMSKNFNDFQYDIKEKKIILNMKNSSLNIEKEFINKDSLFDYLNKKNFKIYINGWYIPYCNIFKNSLYKCFQSSYAHAITFDYYGLKNFLIFQLYNIIPGANFLINKFEITKLYKITGTGSEFEVAKKNFLLSKKSFLSNIKNKNINFYFLHTNIPHAPYIYNYKKNMLVDFKDKDQSNYISNLILADKYLGNIIDELKKQSIFDNSIIIIQGDTGLDSLYKNSTKEDMIGSTPLLIKRSNQKNKFIIEHKINSYELGNYLKTLIN